MSVQKTGNIRRKVTSVGNSWIVCNSRSHPGLVYYFNTLTGEAVWNLSSAEIEKAKQRTKDLEGKSGAKPTRCPEPTQPPNSNILSSTPPSIQYINPFVVNPAVPSSNIAPFANTNQILTQQISQINNPPVNVMNTLEPLNPSISAINVQTTSIYNPKVWAVPLTPQTYILPPTNVLGNHVNGSGVGPFNNFNQTMTQPLGPNSTMQAFNVTNISNQAFTRNFNSNVQRVRHMNKNEQFNSHQKDLRQKLFVKNRIHSVSSESHIVSNRHVGRDTDNMANENEDFNKNEREKRSVDSQILEGPSKIDLTPLKILAPMFSKSDAWFIVTDFDVLVTEYKFLTTLTDSDDECYLMVPRRVIAQLKDYVSSTADVQARRILRFLPQQIEIGYTFMGEEPSHNEGDSIPEVIIATCVTLCDNNFHVILISNNSELLAYKNSIKANIFSVEEIKKILDVTGSHLASDRKPFMQPFERHIKITVPNDSKKFSSVGTSSEEILPINQNVVVSAIEPVMEEKKDETRERDIPKKTADAAIQTDLENAVAIPSMIIIDQENKPDDTKEFTGPTSSDTNVLKRKIKLNRSVSHQNPVSAPESNVKQFKWRRRRNTTQVNTHTTSQCNHTSLQPDSTEVLDINPVNTDLNKQAQNLINISPKIAQNNIRPSEGSIDSKDSSTLIATSKSENVIIEETSTSDIISNTESILDSESNYSNNVVDQQQLVQEDQYYEKPMYEIDSECMEEYLIRKCDEWVSRFVQIMEEVLTQVLQQDPPFSHRAMPPPWTLHEAAQCIAIKFGRHREVKETANKLSSILFHISDSKGIIGIEIKPNEYMQMYSYGVHLIDALSKQIHSCEDLQIAADSLKKLLDDIKNPNIDASTNDTFNETLVKRSTETLEHNVSFTEMDVDLGETLSSFKLNEDDFLNDEESQTNTPQIKSSPVKFIRNIDLKSSFFSNLRQNDDVFTKDLNKSQEQSPKKQISIGSQMEEKGTKNSHVINEPIEESANVNAVDTQQKVIRNFSLCAKYEEKFKSKNMPITFEDPDDELDYEEEYDDGEYLTVQQDDEEFLSQQQDDDEFLSQQQDDDNSFTADMEDMVETNDSSNLFKPDAIDNDLNRHSSKKFNNQCYEELQKPDLSMVQKREKLKQAETAHLNMIRLCQSLKSMADQDYDEAYEKLSKILQQAGVDIRHVDENLISEYRSAVSKSLDYAKTFLNTISDLICAFKSSI